jgi:aspartyl/asparaginyl beta-hydroxylase (cupin superfamily)
MLRDLKGARFRVLAAERRRRLVDPERRYAGTDLSRARAFVEIFNQEREVTWADSRQRPSWMFFPGLEARPWFDPSEFDWVAGLEARAPRIREELRRVIAGRQADIRPYVPEEAGTSADWRPLAGRTDWGSYHLYRGGVRQDDHCEACPETVAALEQVPLMDCPGHAPEAFFSILQPGTRIPPHVGLANTRLTVHLALVIPDGCSITVGGETRTWSEGRTLVFDDSFEHEARNGSDSLRGVLIFEIWNPQLTEAEREVVRTVIEVGERLHRHWEAVAAEILAKIE